MEKKLQKRNANKVVWVEYWIEQMNQQKVKESIDAEKDNNGLYICAINLPVINHSVEVSSQDHVDAVLKAAEMASEKIEEFTKEHPINVVNNPFKNYDYEIYVDEEDNLFIEMTSECRKRIGDEMQKKQINAINSINKAIDDLQKIYGLTDQLYLHITPKNIYKESVRVDDVWKLQEIDIEKNADRVFIPVISYEKDDYVVTLAHLGRKE